MASRYRQVAPATPRRRRRRPARPDDDEGSLVADERVGVVVMTRDRCAELMRTLERLRGLPEQPPVVVVDNGSRDGTVDSVRRLHGWVRLVSLPNDVGAVARTIGIRLLSTPYVAFCDDDTWWEPGALTVAADALDASPGLAVVTGRILVEPGAREDPIDVELRESPVQGPAWLPGPALASFLAGASVVRRDAYLSSGGFEPRLGLGARRSCWRPTSRRPAGSCATCRRRWSTTSRRRTATPGF